MSPHLTRRTVLGLVGGAAGVAGLGAMVHVREAPPDRSAIGVAAAVEWVRRYRGTEGEFTLRGRDGQGVVGTADGGYLIAAEGRPISTSGSDGARKFALLRTDPDGRLVWSRLVDDGIESTEQNARDVAETDDGGFVVVGGARAGDGGGSAFAGDRRQAAVVVATGPDGDRRWGRVYDVPGERNDEAQYDDAYYESHFAAVAPTADGGHVLGGQDSGYEWLVKLDPAGDEVWQGHYDTQEGYRQYAAVSAVTGTADGGAAYVADATLVKVDDQGDIEWTTDATADAATLWDVVGTADGGYAVTGTIAGEEDDPGDFLLATVDPDGSPRWQRRYDGPGEGRDVSLRLSTVDDGLAVAGRMQAAGSGDETLAVLKVAPDGTEQWVHLVDGVTARPADVIRIRDGGIAVTAVADTDGSPDEPAEPILTKLVPGESATATAGTTRLSTADAETGTATDGAFGGSVATDGHPSPTDHAGSTPSSSSPTDGASPAEASTRTDGPGFGIVGGLVALVLAALSRRR